MYANGKIIKFGINYVKLIHSVIFTFSMTLLCALIALLHKISLSDRYFESHREACKLTFAYSLRALKLLFENSDAINSTTSKDNRYIVAEVTLHNVVLCNNTQHVCDKVVVVSVLSMSVSK